MGVILCLQNQKEKIKMEDVWLLVLGGLALALIVVWMIAKLADKGSVRDLWKETFECAEEGDDISQIISRCGEPTEIVENENGVLYLLTYDFVWREGENPDISGCTRYSWIKEEWKGFCRDGYQKRAMHFFTRNDKIVFWYGHNLDMHAY